MADFASLGIKIDSKDVKAASDALDKFATASKNAEEASKTNESQSVKTNLSYEKTVLKLTESKSAYNNVVLASKGYTESQIASINAADKYAQSIKTNQSYQDAQNKTLQRASEIYMDMVNKLSMTDKAYKANQLALKGLNDEQIKHVQSLEAQQTKHTSLISSLGRLAAAYIGIRTAINISKDILETNIQFESLRVQLNGVMGSASEGAATFQRALSWAVKTPFELMDITKAFVTLKNFGIDPTDKTMESLTNAASRLGKGAQGLETITQQLGQAWTKNKLQMQDMRIMMEAGVPVIDLLSKKMGESAATIFKMSENGELGRDVIKLLINEMGKMSAGANAASMETLKGKISNLSDAWHIFEDTLLNDKSEGVIKSIVSSITDAINLLTRNMSASLDAQIAHAQARIDTYNKMNSVAKGATSVVGFVTGQGYSIDDEIAKLEQLKAKKSEQSKVDQNIKSSSEAKAKEELKMLDNYEADAKQRKSIVASEIEDAKLLAQAHIDQYKSELDENERLYKNFSISDNQYFSNKKSLNEKINNENVASINKQIEIQRNVLNLQIEEDKVAAQKKLAIHKMLVEEEAGYDKKAADEQVKTTEALWSKILAIETNGKPGAVSKTGAIGGGQALVSTLLDPGVKDVQPFPFDSGVDLQKMQQIRDEIKSAAKDNNATTSQATVVAKNMEFLKTASKTYSDGLEAWSKTYLIGLINKYNGDISKALAQYGDGSAAYAKLKQEYAGVVVKGNIDIASTAGAIINKSKEQIDAAKTLNELQGELNKTTLDGKSKQLKLEDEVNNQEKEYIKTIEQEKLKLLELTGQTKKARDMKAELELKNNPTYQRAINTGDTATQKIFTDVAAAEKAKPMTDLFKSNAAAIESESVASKYNDLLSQNATALSSGVINEQQFKAEMEKLSKVYNDEFIDPAEKDTKRMTEFTKQAARNMESSLANYLFDPFQQGLSGMLDGFITMIRRMAAEALAAQIMDKLVGTQGKNGSNTGGLLSAGVSALGLFSGGSSASSGFQGNGMLLSYANAHTGGIIGQTTGTTMAHSSDFNYAPHYHTGGIAGLKPNEVPAVLLRGEEVLTENNPRHINNVQPMPQKQQASGDNNYNVTVHVANGTPTEVRRSAAQGARQALSMVSGAKRYE